MDHDSTNPVGKVNTVILHKHIGAGVVGALVLGLFLTPSAAPAEDKTREQQIADLEKQIQDLTKKLNELKGQPPTPSTQPTPSTPAKPTLPEDWVGALKWRCIGPAAMGGRIVAFSVFEADPCTYWVATASGGLLKTVNNGVTFEHQFDHETTVSIGDVCVAPSDRNIVWVGAGENNPRNSVSYGDGVYKSTDGGKTWQNMGLKKTFQIGRIVVHPKDPNIVYVGALGRLYGPNEDRGLYKTTDGGKTWNKVLTIDDKTGVIDVKMSPADPETLLVAAWERRRDEFDSHRGQPPVQDGYDAYDPETKWGPGAGIYKTTDGGKNFHKITKGLPTVPVGRIGIDWYRKDPNEVWAIVDSQKIGMGTPPTQVYLGVQGEDAPDAGGARMEQVSENTPAAKAGLKAGDVIKAVDKKEIKSYKDLLDQITSRKAGDKLPMTVQRGKDTLDVTAELAVRPAELESGNPKRPWGFWYGGQRENAQEKQGPDAFEYGGVYKSADGGESWTRVNSINPRPMYFSHIRVDPSDDKYIYVCGINFYHSVDGGKTFTDDAGKGVHADQHALWIDPKDGRHMLVGCDGGFYATYDRTEHWDFLNNMAIGQFYSVCVDSRQPYHVYGGLQDNGSWGGPSRSLSGALLNEDWIAVLGGDGFVCQVDASNPDVVYAESQDGAMVRTNIKTGQRAGIRPNPQEGQPTYRFNWNTPFILSHHNTDIVYSGGNYVFRSVKQGSDPKIISPEITRTKRGTATALAESPRNPDVLWAGTDDGALWVTRDGGVKWTNVADKVGLPGPRWVASIEASRFHERTAYVVFDGHRSDDDAPYVYVTTDYGETWKPLSAGLPTGSTRVLREDIENENLLYLGTEFAVYASIDRGATWTKINSNLPTVAVLEFAQHPTAGELVAATHGRSLWVVDVAPLRQLTNQNVKAKAALYKPNDIIRWHSEPQHTTIFGGGSRRYIGENPAFGAQLYYSLTAPAKKVRIKIQDFAGRTVRELDAGAEPGLHRVEWNLMMQEQPNLLSMVAGGDRRNVPTPPGMYTVVLSVDDDTYKQGLKIEPDPTTPNAVLTDAPDADQDEDEDRPKDHRVRIDD
ncbi:MAG TPA: PDZ domain-containing protein [Gemmataceae bacterium]|nr:PDZ domain-containing protein [Gemmataceae bacterium]